MPIFDEFGSWLQTLKVYLLGRGALSLLVLGTTMAASALGFGFTAPALVIGLGGAALSAVMRLNSQAQYENKMVDLYRNDIARELGLAPEDVTRSHLHEVAKSNDVIDQALARQRRKNMVSFATSALAGLATFALLDFGLAHQAITQFFTEHFEGAANFLRYASVGLVSGTSSLILHDGLEAAIGQGAGLSKAVAHDLIVGMDRDLRRGRTITPEQVYAVLVTEDSQLDQTIRNQYGTSFLRMPPLTQRKVLEEFHVLEQLDQMAIQLSNGSLSPGHLAYMVGALPPRPAPVIPAEPAARSNFVERLHLAPRTGRSHAEEVLASRNTQADGPALA